MTVKRTLLTGGFLVAVAVGCRENPQQTKLQYMPDMADNPTVKTQESFLEPPEHSIAMTENLYPESVEAAESELSMPEGIASQAGAMKEGKKLYETFCVVCHGPNAQGAGTITDLFPKPPDLTGEMYVNRGDGFFYYRITFGSQIMPGYGYATDVRERWLIVNYLRSLQKAAR